MLIAALILAGLAALLHVYIFVLESLRWTDPATLRTFGNTPQAAEATKELAFNQGFYNLFLAIVTAIGIGLAASGYLPTGGALILAGTGSMLAAAIVLVVKSPSRLRSALTQGTLPLLAVIATGIALASS